MSSFNISGAFQTNKNAWAEGVARFGYAALGVVYLLIGSLTGFTAMGWQGGKISDQKDIFKFILHQPAGKILLIIMVAGMAGYVCWQLIQVVKDPQNHGSGSAKGIGRRVGYAISAFFYTTLGIYAAKLVLGQSTNEQNSQEKAVSTALDLPFGKWLVILAAIIAFGFGLYQIYKGISGKFMKDVQEGTISPEIKKLIKKTGSVGFIARGIVFIIIAYMTGRAGINYNPKAAGGTESAFQFLNSSSFPLLMGVVALGFVCYGLFMFVRARYQNFSM